jgi:hypothetical protein
MRQIPYTIHANTGTSRSATIHKALRALESAVAG